MAEDGGETDDYEEINIEEGRQSTYTRKHRPYQDKRCNARLDELAKPKKWLILATWHEHRFTFDPDRVQALKERIQEEFSMTPEETEVYFTQLRKRARRVLNKKALAKQIRREKANARETAYRIFKKLLRKAMKYAFTNPPPPIVSPMVRERSNKILELLCEIHGIEVLPKRESTDKNQLFLLYLADWAAILLTNIYYEVNINEKTQTERFKKLSVTTLASGQDEALSGEDEGEEEEKPLKTGKGEANDVITEEDLTTDVESEPVTEVDTVGGSKTGDDTVPEDEMIE